MSDKMTEFRPSTLKRVQIYKSFSKQELTGNINRITSDTASKLGDIERTQEKFTRRYAKHLQGTAWDPKRSKTCPDIESTSRQTRERCLAALKGTPWGDQEELHKRRAVYMSMARQRWLEFREKKKAMTEGNEHLKDSCEGAATKSPPGGQLKSDGYPGTSRPENSDMTLGISQPTQHQQYGVTSYTSREKGDIGGHGKSKGTKHKRKATHQDERKEITTCSETSSDSPENILYVDAHEVKRSIEVTIKAERSEATTSKASSDDNRIIKRGSEEDLQFDPKQCSSFADHIPPKSFPGHGHHSENCAPQKESRKLARGRSSELLLARPNTPYPHELNLLASKDSSAQPQVTDLTLSRIPHSQLNPLVSKTCPVPTSLMAGCTKNVNTDLETQNTTHAQPPHDYSMKHIEKDTLPPITTVFHNSESSFGAVPSGKLPMLISGEIDTRGLDSLLPPSATVSAIVSPRQLDTIHPQMRRGGHPHRQPNYFDNEPSQDYFPRVQDRASKAAKETHSHIVSRRKREKQLSDSLGLSPRIVHRLAKLRIQANHSKSLDEEAVDMPKIDEKIE